MYPVAAHPATVPFAFCMLFVAATGTCFGYNRATWQTAFIFRSVGWSMRLLLFVGFGCQF